MIDKEKKASEITVTQLMELSKGLVIDEMAKLRLIHNDMLGVLVWYAIKHEEISLGRGAELMGMYYEEFREWLEANKDRLDIQLPPDCMKEVEPND